MPETRKKRQPKETDSETQSDFQSDSDSAQTRAIPFGRPTKFTQEIADEIIWRITHGEPLVKICRDEHMPHVATIYRWLSQFNDFCDMYTKAKEDQADTLAEQIQDIADQMPLETTDKDGNTKFDSAYINWMRLRIDARKWTASKLKPRKYGDRVALAGDEDNPLKVEATVEAKGLFDTLLQNMELQKQAAK